MITYRVFQFAAKASDKWQYPDRSTIYQEVADFLTDIGERFIGMSGDELYEQGHTRFGEIVVFYKRI